MEPAWRSGYYDPNNIQRTVTNFLAFIDHDEFMGRHHEHYFQFQILLRKKGVAGDPAVFYSKDHSGDFSDESAWEIELQEGDLEKINPFLTFLRETGCEIHIDEAGHSLSVSPPVSWSNLFAKVDSSVKKTQVCALTDEYDIIVVKRECQDCGNLEIVHLEIGSRRRPPLLRNG
jgi:hypothetical protein